MSDSIPPASNEEPKKRNRIRSLEFVPPFHRIVGLGPCGIDCLPPDEFGQILASQSQAIRILELKTSGYNQSQAQTDGPEVEFNRGQFVFRRMRYLPAIQHQILTTIEANDLDYFVRLGKTISAIKKRPVGDDADPLGYFLVRNWMAQEGSRVPSFCLLSVKVLRKVCWICRCDAEGDKLRKQQAGDEYAEFGGKIETTISRLGLRRASRLFLASCGYDEERQPFLYVAGNESTIKSHSKQIKKEREEDRNRKASS